MSQDIPTVEMAKCEGCGQYHPVSECEVVIIKMVKGKNCPLVPIQQTAVREVVRGLPPIDPVIVAPAVVNDQPPVKRRSIIPRDILATMVDPNDPKHSSVAHLAATETRRAG